MEAAESQALAGGGAAPRPSSPSQNRKVRRRWVFVAVVAAVAATILVVFLAWYFTRPDDDAAAQALVEEEAGVEVATEPTVTEGMILLDKPTCVPHKLSNDVKLSQALHGYDPGFSNPYHESGDPGFRRGKIFEHDCINDKNVPGFYDYITVTTDENCKMSMSSTVMSSYKEYLEERSSAISSSDGWGFKSKAGGFGVSVSASASHNSESSQEERSIKQAFESQDGEMVSSETKCFTNDLSISTFTRPLFTIDFINALEELNATLSSSDEEKRRRIYIQFTEQFGPHFLRDTDFGASLVAQKMYQGRSQSQQEMSQREDCFAESSETCAGGGGGFGGFSASFEACVNSENSECLSSRGQQASGGQSSQTKLRVVSRGSRAKSDVNAWIDSEFKPIPIAFGLDPIEDLITRENLAVNPNYKINVALDADGLKLFLEENRAKYYCTGVLGLTAEECSTDPFAACGLGYVCQPGLKCVEDRNEERGFKCVKPEVRCAKKIVAGTFRQRGFEAKNVLIDSCNDAEDRHDADGPSWWFAPDGARTNDAYFTVDLGCSKYVSKYTVRSTGSGSDRGTWEMLVSVATESDPHSWRTIGNDFMDDVRNKQCPEKETFDFNFPQEARYVKLKARSYYGKGAALQFFDVE